MYLVLNSDSCFVGSFHKLWQMLKVLSQSKRCCHFDTNVILLLQVATQDDGLLSVGADIQFRIWNPVLSVVSVQDLNASTRMTAQNLLTQSLAKKTVREIQTQRLKLGEYLGVRRHQSYSALAFH